MSCTSLFAQALPTCPYRPTCVRLLSCAQTAILSPIEPWADWPSKHGHSLKRTQFPFYIGFSLFMTARRRFVFTMNGFASYPSVWRDNLLVCHNAVLPQHRETVAVPMCHTVLIPAYCRTVLITLCRTAYRTQYGAVIRAIVPLSRHFEP